MTLALIGVVPWLMANKSCKSSAPWEHPAIDKTMACSTCHDDGRTRQTPPPGHDATWIKNHGKTIQKFGFKAASTCTVCHTEATCTQCHQQEAPANHNEYWKLRGHGLTMGLNRNQCTTCHRSDFCERCHSETTPVNHRAAWGSPTNQHCQNCHFPITAAGAQKCAVCHQSTPSHDEAPTRPNNSLHGAGADCRGCHVPLGHPDNGMSCTVCHAQ